MEETESPVNLKTMSLDELNHLKQLLFEQESHCRIERHKVEQELSERNKQTDPNPIHTKRSEWFATEQWRKSSDYLKRKRLAPKLEKLRRLQEQARRLGKEIEFEKPSNVNAAPSSQ